MNFNFDKMTNRFNTNSYKWDVGYKELPMWVADMDFETSPAIIKAMQKRLNHHIFGYTSVQMPIIMQLLSGRKIDINFMLKKNGLCFVPV